MSNTIAVPTSTVSRKFFLFTGIILALQFLFGLAAAAQFIWPTFLANVLRFNVTRMLHINALIIALLAGFMGATYFLIAEEGGGKLASEKSATWNFWLWQLESLP
jgi:nitric oxide reductase subunit B